MPFPMRDPLHMQRTNDIASKDTITHTIPASPNGPENSTLTAAFWRNRLIEVGLILSMALYYLIGNKNFPIPVISHVSPLLSLPFLLIFAVLCWYRLPVAVALLPLSLPYYLLQKNIYSHYDFSLVEITLWTCIAVAVLQALVQQRTWPYRLSWAELRERVGPLLIPILLFAAAAAFSIVIAYAHGTALRAFREEVLGPLLYLVLALYCLRSRQDVARLLGALIGTAFVIAVFGLIQYFFFKHTLVLESDGIRRVHTVYGSANSIGLLFDYAMPVAIAWLLAAISWRQRLLALIACIPLAIVLYLTQSHGAWIAIPIAALFVATFSALPYLHVRALLLIGGVIVLVAIVSLFAFHDRLFLFLFEGHTNGHVSTLTKRIYLWETALHMIEARPWFGFGMDNWLCYYSLNNICNAHQFHYWIVSYPPHTGIDTGLREEPTLSHPHNILLQIWVSMGVFGVLAFISVVALFYRLFARILRQLNAVKSNGYTQLRWMTIGVGGAMLAALIQGMVDSSFLEQDLAFCFWILVIALLLLRVLSDTSWRTKRT